MLTDLAVVFGLAALLALLGSRFSGLLTGSGDSALYRALLDLLAGCVALHLLLTLLDGLGVAWTVLTLLAAVALTAALAHRFVPRNRERTRLPSDLGWGDALAFAAVAVFALFALTLWIVTPDFVYHWGLKGHRFFLDRGIDYPYLARSWNAAIHPDYPNLLPEIYAVTALLGRGFREPAMMLWSVVWLAGLPIAAREALRRAGSDRSVQQATVALVALAAAAFGIGYRMGGAADWMISLALLAALPPLLAPPGRESDLQIGVIAAFAAASKTEGVPLAAFLVLVQLARRVADGAGEPQRLRRIWRPLLRLALPSAAVVLPWLAAVHRFGLFQEFNAGAFAAGRASVVFAALAKTFQTEEWYGMSWSLALLPLLGLDRRLRPAAAAISLQLLFYLYVYFTARVDVQFLVLSSFPRLLLHLIPPTLVALAVAVPWSPRQPS